jgi:thiol-disulfide isomerase/thioredoxin
MKTYSTTFSFFQKILLLSVLFLAEWSVFGQKNTMVTIEGKTTFAAGEEVRIIAVEDYISMRQETIASEKIDRNGCFKIIFQSPKIKLIQIEVRTSKAEFFIVPGYHYTFDITMDPQLFDLLDPEMFGGFLQVRSHTVDTLDMNYKINRFNFFYDRALNDYQYALAVEKRVDVYDSLILDFQRNFEIRYAPENFYLNYLYYTVGALEMLIYSKSTRRLFEKYLGNEYILYDNPAYMAFFKDFYNQYLYTSPAVSKNILKNHINLKPDYNALFNELGKIDFLRNERIRELVIIYNLYQFAGHEEFEWNSVASLLRYIKENTHFPEHRKIVENVLYVILKYHELIPVPATHFKQENGNSFQFKTLNGKWVYLHFFNTRCLDCIREMLIIKELQQKFKDNITFVSICLDHDFATFRTFKKDYSMFEWEFIHFNNNYEWLRKLEILALPDNILLNDKGEIYLRYAPDPSKDLTLLLEKLFSEKENTNPVFNR